MEILEIKQLLQRIDGGLENIEGLTYDSKYLLIR